MTPACRAAAGLSRGEKGGAARSVRGNPSVFHGIFPSVRRVPYFLLVFLATSAVVWVPFQWSLAPPPVELASAAAASVKALAESEGANITLQVARGLLSQFGQLARQTTASVRRFVHQGISAARQTDTYKSLKYAVNRGAEPTEKAMEERLSRIGKGLSHYLSAVDAVHPSHRKALLPELITSNGRLEGVMFKYAGLKPFSDPTHAFHRLEEFARTFRGLATLCSGPPRAGSANEKTGGRPAAAGRSPPASFHDTEGQEEDDESSSSESEDVQKSTRGGGLAEECRAEELTLAAVKPFEDEVGQHLSFLASMLTATPQDAEKPKLYVRRMLPRLKDAIRAAWLAVTNNLSQDDRAFHLRYLMDYIVELKAMDFELGKLSAIIPSSDPPFNPLSHYYGTPPLVVDL